MKSILTVILFSIIFISCEGSSLKNGDSLAVENLESKVDNLVKSYIDIDIFSGVVLIAKDGKPVYHKAFGLANREQIISNTINTHFDLGSMNKTFTKVAALKLVDEGKLKLNDKLRKFLDGFPTEAAEKITVQHLLNHQSGYGGYHTPEYWEIPLEEKSLQTALNQIRTLPLMFAPGTDREYSNAGYVLLGLIIEKAAGKSYYDVIEEKITKPLELKNTFLRDKYSVPNRAIGYYKNMRGELFSNEEFGEIPTPAGGFYSTTSDILKFYRAYFYGDKLWNDEIRKLDEGFRFFKEQMNTGGAIPHAGGFEGSNTVLYEILRDRISVVVFANMDEVVAENLGAGILDIIRNKIPDQPSLPAEQAVYNAYEQHGINYIKTNWEKLTKNWHPSDPKDMILNQMGYEFLFDENVNDALKIFELNTELFPEIANCWDSYGEALLKSGDKHASLKAYKKALSINPNMESAKNKIMELSGDN
ncbi:MAG: serine hydrolase [Melioribacteraceae bacterium]|nr:serine hydrolase [Melioribacteraceae bacterium]MCF8263418.1 serine hydrolase [Melioribacteraceae bacterium]MCF8430416.1 serine hydrolase [Melioribacteraceae bacterium]